MAIYDVLSIECPECRARDINADDFDPGVIRITCNKCNHSYAYARHSWTFEERMLSDPLCNRNKNPFIVY